MPVRIMVWNIQSFTGNKFFATPADPGALIGGHIYNTIQSVNPQIFVVIELRGPALLGTGTLLAPARAGTGVDDILAFLRNNLAATWMVVPPLALNIGLTANGNAAYTEGAAVFFDSAAVTFTGPNKYTALGSIDMVTAGAATNYPAGWNNSLPAGAPGDGNPLSQRQRAGKATYLDANGHALYFPLWWARSPFLTTFQEVIGGRPIKLMTVHCPPQPAFAREATASLAQVPEMAAACVVANEVRVIAGDFNTNSLNPNQADAFQHLTAGAQTVNTVNAVSAVNYTMHFAAGTMLRKVVNGTPAVPAGYQKQSSGYYLGADNILTYYCTQPDGAANALVVDRVNGAGGFASDMANQIPWIMANVPPVAQAWQFQQMPNYAKIRGASDHMALMIDV